MQIWPRKKARTHLAIVAVSVILCLAIGAFTFQALPWLFPVLVVALVLYDRVAMGKYRRRRALMRTPFPQAWVSLLERRVPFYAQLDGEGRDRFETDVRIFVAEQTIYGPRGAEVDDEIKVLVAASAAILCHGMPDWEWPSLRDIIIYKTSFNEDYEVGGGEPILGMVHHQGPIVFSARDLKHGFNKPSDGLNVGLHELAHVMDLADGSADGVPAGLEFVATAPWIQVMADRLERVRNTRNSTVLRDYAGTNEVETFAVAVEVFFERPRRLKKRDPELYELLADYFNQDPAAGRS